MADLVLGPVLRHVSQADATVWVQTDSPCEVAVLDHAARTFEVEGHHYALVCLTGLRPGRSYAYQVHLDGRRAWPPPDYPFPPCAIRTLPDPGPVRVSFGSCRVSAPHHPPYSQPRDVDPRGRGVDALDALTRRMRDQGPARWPHVMLWLGDQVYADELSPSTRAFIARRRGSGSAPHDQVADFVEYTRLYRESWLDPAVRWFLSTVSSSMIWDDHDVHDDWNTSAAWQAEMRTKPWWDARITGAIGSYWVYQHLGNLSPHELEHDGMWQAAREGGDVTEPLRAFSIRADREASGSRWSFCRDLGRARLVMMDSRAGRVLDGGRREMLDEREWEWVTAHARGGFDHLLLGTSLPWLLWPGMHYLEAWNEAVCAGAWGHRAAGWGERVRQGLDLEHWAAFRDSFDRLCGLVGDVAAGALGEPPAAIVALSGDVHHAYLAEVALPRPAGARSAVYQAVCSPVRNPLGARERRAIELAMTRPARAAGRALARLAGVPDPPLRWRIGPGGGPWFDNLIGSLDIDGPSLDLRLERAVAGADGRAGLETVLERRLA